MRMPDAAPFGSRAAAQTAATAQLDILNQLAGEEKRRVPHACSDGWMEDARPA
jgi:hypothetical protein